jgi:hypothetical protein
VVKDLDETIGKEIVMEAFVNWRKRCRPEVFGWPKQRQDDYAQGWADATLSNVELFDDLYHRFDPKKDNPDD